MWTTDGETAADTAAMSSVALPRAPEPSIGGTAGAGWTASEASSDRTTAVVTPAETTAATSAETSTVVHPQGPRGGCANGGAGGGGGSGVPSGWVSVRGSAVVSVIMGS